MKSEFKSIYFVGIGGIGMSALARYFNNLGIQVFGYDKVETVLTNKLIEEGMSVHYEDNISLIPDGIDLVVYTPAIPDNHKELNYFQDNNFKILKRAQVLGLISADRKTIGVAGTHGKTTTTAILTHILKSCGVDCTSFMGGIARNFESNFVAGKSEWVVMEADEFDRSFLNIFPEMAVITSMDADHLDIYGDKLSLHQSFREYVSQVKDTLFYQSDLPLSSDINSNIAFEKYGFDDADVKALNIRAEAPFFIFDWCNGDSEIKNLKFTLPGIHNVLNATVAIAIAKKLGCDDDRIRKALLSFKGIKRRFEFVINNENQIFIDDYAHHPEELNAAIFAVKSLYPDSRITGVFQPHLFSRTKDFAAEFAKALDQLDELILMDIYPARELPLKGVTSDLIFNQLSLENKMLIRKSQLLNELKNRKTEVLLTLGAGDIGTLIPDIKDLFSESLKIQKK